MSNYFLHYVSQDVPGDGGEPLPTWSVYREEYRDFADEEPIDGSTVRVETCASEGEAYALANSLQRLYRTTGHLPGPVEKVLYADEDGVDLLIDDRHNVNFVPSVYSRFATDYRDRDGNPMRAEIHPTRRTWYVEVQR